MKEFIKKNVVITLKSGVGIQGVPLEWTDERVVLVYEDNENYTVIFNPKENVMMVSVFAQQKKQPVRPEQHDIPKPVVEPPEVELDHFEPDPGLRAMKLADLHLEKKKALKEQLSHHFKSRTATFNPVMYESPNFTK